VRIGEEAERERVERAYREQRVKMLKTLFAYTRSRTIAEDAVSEAFAQAIHRGSEIRDVSAWVWKAAFRIASGELSRPREIELLDTESSYEMDEPAADLVHALSGLSPKQRACVLLHHYAGYPVREVGEIVGSSVAAVKVHLSTGRRRLRAILEVRDA
jgi:RNA polymerase sigma-70 factor (ECF subfamily)